MQLLGMDESGFADLYDADAEGLLVFFVRRTLDGQVALDLWAETLAAAFAAWRRCRARDRAGQTSWLYGIAYRQLALYWRRGAAEQRAIARLGLERPTFNDGELERLEELAGLDGLRAQVGQALADLPDQQREAVRLRIVQELPYDEVADRLCVSEPAARARVSRGLRALRLAVAPQEALP